MRHALLSCGIFRWQGARFLAVGGAFITDKLFFLKRALRKRDGWPSLGPTAP